MAQIYTDIEKYIKKEDDLALEQYEVDEIITVVLVPYKEISYKYDSGYGAYCCELVVDTDEMPDTFKISGNFVSQLNIGQTYKATGKITIYNRKKQLKVDEIKKVEPKTIRTIKQFVKSLDGMGPFYDVIYEEFGENSLNIIRTCPLEVKKVAPALYDALVLDWQRQLLELKDSQEYLTTLINYGLKPIQAKQFFDMYKEQSDRYYLYLLCSILILGVTIITFSVVTICKNKRNKKKKMNKKKNNKKKRIEDLDL